MKDEAEFKESLIEGIDYQFEPDIEHSFQSNSIPVRIKTGPFKDVIICYGRISFEDEMLKFFYDVVESNKHKDLEQNLEFKIRLGDMLVSIMQSLITEEDNEAGRDNNKGVDS